MWPEIKQIPDAIERMDGALVSDGELLLVERALDRINYFSGAFFRSAGWLLREYKLHASLHSGPFSFLDVGCGAGGLLRYLYLFAQRRGLKVAFFGIEINNNLLEIGRSKNYLLGPRAAHRNLEIEYSLGRIEETKREYSLIHSNLVLHHLRPDEVASFLISTKDRAVCATRHEDLLRSRTGMLLARCFPRLITRSAIVQHDALVSVQRAYSSSEWRSQAAAGGYSYRTVFPERVELQVNS